MVHRDLLIVAVRHVLSLLQDHLVYMSWLSLIRNRIRRLHRIREAINILLVHFEGTARATQMLHGIQLHQLLGVVVLALLG